MHNDEKSPKMEHRSRLIELNVMGVRVRLEVSGSRADEVVADVLATWDRCDAHLLDAEDASPVDEALTVRAMLDDDKALIEQAWKDGTIASELLAGVTEQLTPMITLKGIEHHSGDRVMLHASGLADPKTGRTALLVGPSGAGKSTASRTLAKALSYVSDETICVDALLDIAAYPKPLSLFPEGRTWGKEQISPTTLGLGVPPERLSLGALVMLSRNADGPEEPVVTELSTAEALVRLGEQTSYLGRLERPLHRLAEVVHAAGGAQLVEYREADSLVDIVNGLLEREPAPVAPAADESAPLVVTAELGEDVEPGELLRRCELHDLYVEDGAGVAFVDSRLIALSELATSMLLLLGAGPVSVNDLAASLVAEFGAPEGMDALDLTRGVVDELGRNGLLDYA